MADKLTLLIVKFQTNITSHTLHCSQVMQNVHHCSIQTHILCEAQDHGWKKDPRGSDACWTPSSWLNDISLLNEYTRTSLTSLQASVSGKTSTIPASSKSLPLSYGACRPCRSIMSACNSYHITQIYQPREECATLLCPNHHYSNSARPSESIRTWKDHPKHQHNPYSGDHFWLVQTASKEHWMQLVSNINLRGYSLSKITWQIAIAIGWPYKKLSSRFIIIFFFFA